MSNKNKSSAGEKANANSTESKTSASLFSAEEREKMNESLSTLGFNGADKLSDLEVAQKLRDLALAKNQEALDNKVSTESIGREEKLRMYAAGTKLKSLKFIDRLFNLNVHKSQLEAFDLDDEKLSDEDALTDTEIWNRIRESGIETISGKSHFAKQFQEPVKKKIVKTIR